MYVPVASLLRVGGQETSVYVPVASLLRAGETSPLEQSLRSFELGGTSLHPPPPCSPYQEGFKGNIGEGSQQVVNVPDRYCRLTARDEEMTEEGMSGVMVVYQCVDALAGSKGVLLG